MASASDLKTSSAALNNENTSKEPIFCEQSSDSVIDLVTDQLNALFVENETRKVKEEADTLVRYFRGKFSQGVYARYITNLCEMLNLKLNIKFHALELFDLFMANHFSQAMRVARGCFGVDWPRKWPATLSRIEDQMILRMVSCVQIAAKIRLNEDSVRMSSLMYVLRRCKQTFDKNSVLASEIRVLKTVDFVINQRTPLDFVEILIEALGRNEPSLQTQNLYRVAVDVVDVVYFVKAELYQKLRERLRSAIRGGTGSAAAAGVNPDSTGSFKTPKKDFRTSGEDYRTPNKAERTPKSHFRTPGNDFQTPRKNFRTEEMSFGIFKTPQTMPMAKESRGEKHRRDRGKSFGNGRTEFAAKISKLRALSKSSRAEYAGNSTPKTRVQTQRVDPESLFTPMQAAPMSSKTGTKSKIRGEKAGSETPRVSRESLFTPVMRSKGKAAEKSGREVDLETSLFSPVMSSKSKGKKAERGEDDASEMDRKSFASSSCMEEKEEKVWEMMENDSMFLAAAVISASAYILDHAEFARVLEGVVDIVQLPFDSVTDFSVVLLEYLLIDK